MYSWLHQITILKYMFVFPLRHGERMAGNLSLLGHFEVEACNIKTKSNMFSHFNNVWTPKHIVKISQVFNEVRTPKNITEFSKLFNNLLTPKIIAKFSQLLTLKCFDSNNCNYCQNLPIFWKHSNTKKYCRKSPRVLILTTFKHPIKRLWFDSLRL